MNSLEREEISDLDVLLGPGSTVCFEGAYDDEEAANGLCRKSYYSQLNAGAVIQARR